MDEREEVNLDATSGAEPMRQPYAPRRARAKAALTRQRIRAAAQLGRALGKAKAAGGRVKAARKAKCPECGSRLAANVKFCPGCGTEASATSTPRPRPEAAVKKPMLLQRGAAQVIDRLLPLPFLVYPYPRWIWVVGAFHLLCEIGAGRSPGKWIWRMRVVDARTLRPCGPIRGVIRRIGAALAQMAYCRWEWAPFAAGYDLISFLFVWASRDGRKIEDNLLRTRVIGEGRFRKLKRQCEWCKAMVSGRARFCPHCGKEPR